MKKWCCFVVPFALFVQIGLQEAYAGTLSIDFESKPEASVSDNPTIPLRCLSKSGFEDCVCLSRKSDGILYGEIVVRDQCVSEEEQELIGCFIESLANDCVCLSRDINDTVTRYKFKTDECGNISRFFLDEIETRLQIAN